MHRKKIPKIGAILAAVGIWAVANTAYASFDISSLQGTEKLYFDDSYDGVTSLTAHVGSQTSTDLIDITTVQRVSAASGFATIKPFENDILSSITFTPDGESYSTFSFHALLADAPGDITLTVQDNQGNLPQTFTFTAGNGNDGFAIASTDGETIKYVKIENPSFKQVKQIEVSFGVVPEPTTMVAGALLLLPFGASTIRALRNRRA